MTTEIEKRPELYPHAQVPGATSLSEVFEAWRARGLTPVQVTSDEALQTITITHNALTGELKWTATKADGVQAVSLLFSVLVDMGEQYFTASARPQLTSGTAQIALLLNGNQIQMIAEPADDPVVLRGVLVAALLRLIEKAKSPAETLAGVMTFDVG